MSKRNNTNLDAKLDWVKDRLSKTIDIALERVIAHNENPQYYPLPSDPRSLERALHELFETLPRENKKDVIEKVNKTLKAGRDARVKIYGDLVDINFRSTAPVVDQVKAKPVPANLKITEADVTEMRSRLKLPAAAKPQKVVPAQAVEATELGFDVVSLKCIRPTDLRKDEVSLAGFAVDNVGGDLVVEPFFVSDFKRDETVALGAQGRLFNFKLTEGQFPKTFTASVILVEKDLVRNNDFVRALIKVCYNICLALSTLTLGVLAVGLLGGPLLGALIIALSGGAFFFVTIAKILDFMRDDLASLGTDVLVLDAPVAPGTTFDRGPIQSDVGHYLKGKYEATIRWVTA